MLLLRIFHGKQQGRETWLFSADWETITCPLEGLLYVFYLTHPLFIIQRMCFETKQNTLVGNAWPLQVESSLISFLGPPHACLLQGSVLGHLHVGSAFFPI